MVMFKGGDFEELEVRCDHPSVEQQNPDGSTYWAPHPSFVGKKDNNGVWATNALSAYPAKLNRKIAFIISKAIAAGRGS